MASTVQPPKSELCLQIPCVHCGATMFVYLDYALERMGSWDLEEIEGTIGEVKIKDGAVKEKVGEGAMEVDGGAMEIDGVDKNKQEDEGYTVNVSHHSGEKPCGMVTELGNKEFHEIVLKAKKVYGV